jgi:hypothetical protein
MDGTHLLHDSGALVTARANPMEMLSLALADSGSLRLI